MKTPFKKPVFCGLSLFLLLDIQVISPKKEKKGEREFSQALFCVYFKTYVPQTPKNMSTSSAEPSVPVSRYGDVIIAGSASYSLTGRSNPPSQGYDGVPETNHWNFVRFTPLCGKKIVKVFSGCTSVHYFALDIEGLLYAWGRNERGQLGLGDTRNRYVPTPVTLPGKVLACATGKSHSIVVLDNGMVMATGENKMGQCGVGKSTEYLTKFEKCAGLPAGASIAPSVGAGNEFSVVIAGESLYTCMLAPLKLLLFSSGTQKTPSPHKQFLRTLLSPPAPSPSW